MKPITKALLIGATVASTATAGVIQNTSLTHQKENILLSERLKESSTNYDKLQLRNKKLSKRVIAEINRIMTLSDSIKHLDQSIKEERTQLSHKILLAKKIKSKNKTLTSRQKKASIQSGEKMTKVESDILTAKTNVLEIKESIVKPLFISDVATSLMKKKIRGGYAITGNRKKIDGFKTHFQILNNNYPNQVSEKKITLNLHNLNDESVSYSHQMNLDFDQKFIEVSAIIQVERKEIISGNYELVISIDNEKIKSSNIQIASR